MVVESEIIYIRSRFSPLVGPQKFSSLPIQTLSTSSIAQVERTQRSGETRGFRIIQEACSMNERLHKSAIFTKLFRALYLRTEEAGVRKGEGDHRAIDYRDWKDRSYRDYPSTISKFQPNDFPLFARFDGCFPRVKSLAWCQLLSTLLARDQSKIILAPWHEKPVGIKLHLRVFMRLNRIRLRNLFPKLSRSTNRKKSERFTRMVDPQKYPTFASIATAVRIKAIQCTQFHIARRANTLLARAATFYTYTKWRSFSLKRHGKDERREGNPHSRSVSLSTRNNHNRVAILIESGKEEVHLIVRPQSSRFATRNYVLSIYPILRRVFNDREEDGFTLNAQWRSFPIHRS